MAFSNGRRLATAIATAYIADIIFNELYHGRIMMDTYMSFGILRDAEQMDTIKSFCFLGHLILVIIAGLIFPKGYEKKGTSEGLRFGLLIGLILASQTMVLYVWLPLPEAILNIWIAGNLLEGTIIGCALSMVYGMKLDDKKPAKAKKSKKK